MTEVVRDQYGEPWLLHERSGSQWVLGLDDERMPIVCATAGQTFHVDLSSPRGVRDIVSTGWQPISTAPKDGTRILVVWPDGSRGVAWWTTNLRIVRMLERIEAGEPYSPDWCSAMQSSHFIDHGEWDDYEVSLPKNQPTHWMPLPEPPA